MEYLIIDPLARKITIPKSEQLFGVYGEGNIERKHFKCPKIVGDNVDLSDCYIFVNYYTASGLPGKYTVKDVNADGENITFSWELKRQIFDANEDTSIYFAVEAKNKDKAEVFRTRPTTGKAKETIDTDTEIEETYADAILDLISRVDTLEKEPISDEKIEKSVKSYLEKNPIEETDPTVPAWAKEEEKPTYTAEEVGALPSTTVIPSKLSELTADDEHETVTKEEKQAWNAKSDFSGEYRDLRGKPELAEWALQSEKRHIQQAKSEHCRTQRKFRKICPIYRMIQNTVPLQTQRNSRGTTRVIFPEIMKIYKESQQFQQYQPIFQTHKH